MERIDADNRPLNVVAVFAHPDDEAACIGTIANHVDRGDNCHMIFLTKGENASSLRGSPKEIVEIRIGHTRKIEEILGAKYHLMDLPDLGVTPNVENAKKLASLFKEFKPDIIITWGKSIQIGAGHPDHRYTFDIALDAISYARYNNPTDNHPPHRAPVSLYTPLLTISVGQDASMVYVDVSKQLEKINAVLTVYEEAYGKWPVFQFKSAAMMMIGRAANVRYAEAFKQLMWRTARDFLD